MTYDLMLQGAVLEDLDVSDDQLKLRITCKNSKQEVFNLLITLSKTKYKKLPPKGTLEDGELYGIFGKPLNACLASSLSYSKEIELILTSSNKDYEIHAKSIKIETLQQVKA